MNFTWDDEKVQLNLKKHGITFQEAQSIFDDFHALYICDPDHSPNHSDAEDRFILLGLSATLRILVVCHCYRKNDEEIRIISARKATKPETTTYTERK